MTRRPIRPGIVHVTLADGTQRIGRDLRFTTERVRSPLQTCLWLRKIEVEVCHLTDLNGIETRIGPIREMRWT